MTTKYLPIFNLGSIQKFSFLIQRFYVWLNVFIKLLFPEKKRKLTCGDFCLTETRYQCKRRCAGKDTKLNSYILQKSFFFSWGYELYLIQRTQEIKNICHNNTLKLSGEREIKGFFFEVVIPLFRNWSVPCINDLILYDNHVNLSGN